MSTLERNLKGLLGTKLGMTQVLSPERDGYTAVQIGFGEIDGRKVTRP